MSRLISIAISLFLLISIDCSEEIVDNNYPQEMRLFVQNISEYAKSIDSNFIIIPQNGQELLTTNLDENGSVAVAYINSIDGVGREDLFYGYEDDNAATSQQDIDYMMSYLTVAKNNGISVLVTDYCYTHSKMDDSYKKNEDYGFISYAAETRELNKIQFYPTEPYKSNNNDILTLKDAKNFLYLLSPDDNYATKDLYLDALKTSNHDVLIIDAFYAGDSLTVSDISSLSVKANGSARLVIAYMSIGEAEDYRYYWKNEWNNNPPSWMAGENPAWPGNYKVKYWDPQWQSLIFGTSGSYLDFIINAGFDGAYLDIIDAFEYFMNEGKWWIQY